MTRVHVTFSERTAWDRRRNRLSLRRAEREAAGRPLVDLTESNPTRCGLSPTGVGLGAVDLYEPEARGLAVAREAVAAWYGRGVEPADVVLTAGTSEAYGFLIKLLCEPGEAVLVPRPSYPLFDFLAGLEGVVPRPYLLRPDGRFGLDPTQLVGSLTAHARAVLVVSPGNPTGCYLSGEDERWLGELCAERGLALVVDEVFGTPERSVTRHDWPCLCFALSGLSKAVGLPQLKLAWCVVRGPRALRDEALARLELVADTYLSVGSPVQRAAPELLALSAPFRRRVAERCAANRAALARARPAAAAWDLLEAEAGWSAVLRVPDEPDEESRCLALLERGIVVHPGYFFDFPQGAHLVLSLLEEPAVFAAAAAVLAKDLEKTS
jgi:aspartate/methionine/tyrosine aminotransferase